MNSYNAWKSPREIFTQEKTHKLGREILATNICVEAEKMFPNLFKAVSLNKNILHIEINKEDVLNFKMIEGKLMKDINNYSKNKNYGEFGVVEKIKLTIIKK